VSLRWGSKPYLLTSESRLHEAAQGWGTPDWVADVERFRGDLVRVALRTFRLNDEDARDLVQEVIAAWLRYAASKDGDLPYNSETHLFATLHKMLLQRFIDGRRRKAMKAVPIPREQAAEESPIDPVLVLELQELARREVARLPELRREALKMCIVDGYTQDEAADRLGIDRRLISAWKRSLEARLAKRARDEGLDG